MVLSILPLRSSYPSIQKEKYNLSFIDIILLIVIGIVTGGINTVAGGGSLIVLPLLIFMGLPPAVANATNRLAIFTQTTTSMLGFKSKGVSSFRFSLLLSATAVIGALIGSMISLQLNEHVLNRTISVVMVLVVLSFFHNPGYKQHDQQDIPKKWLSVMLFFFVGLYGGFLQAGVGFLIIAILRGINGLNLTTTNAIKVFVVLIYTGVALGYFIWKDMIWWQYGIILAAGNAVGGWLASRWSVGIEEKYLKVFLAIMVVLLATKLWFIDQ